VRKPARILKAEAQWLRIRPTVPRGADPAVARQKVEDLISTWRINRAGFPKQQKLNRRKANAIRKYRELVIDPPRHRDELRRRDELLAQEGYYRRGADPRSLKIHELLDILVVFRNIGGTLAISTRSPAIPFVHAIERAIGDRKLSTHHQIKKVTAGFLRMRLTAKADLLDRQ
jgi:hypothetical protein